MATTADPVVRIKVGNAPCSFGVMAGFEPDPPLTYLDVLDQVANSGYAGTELGDWGFMPGDAVVLKPALDQRNLAMIGAFTPLELTDPANLGSAAATALRSARLLAACASPRSAPGPYLILAADAALHPLRRRVAGRVKPAHSLSDAEVRAVARAVNQIASEVVAETGIATVFHPHCGTPVETVVETSVLAMMTDPDLVAFCFDTGHVAYAGDDLDEWLTLFAARTRLVHFKDINPVVANWARGNTWDYDTAVREGLFCPLGEGALDFRASLHALVGVGYAGWIVVEDEIPPGRVPPLQAATKGPRVPPRTRPLTSSLGVALIGAGSMGRVHAANLASGRIAGARLVAVADSDQAAAETCAAEQGVASAYGDSDQALSDPAVDAIVIATPAATHGDLIRAAASAGKHVFTEKPLDTSLERIDAALAAVGANGVKLQIGFHRRFDTSFLQARNAVAAGRVGEPYVMHIISRDPVWRVPPKIDGLSGLLFDTTIHDFDMARFVLGEVESLYAVGTPAVHKAGVPDTLVVNLKFQSGALGTIENGQAVFGYDQRLEVFGSLGAVTVENQQRDTTSVIDDLGLHAPLPPTFYPERYAAAYIAELQSFVDCLRDGVEPCAAAADGRAATVIALAAQRSLDEGRPVAVSEIGA